MGKQTIQMNVAFFFFLFLFTPNILASWKRKGCRCWILPLEKKLPVDPPTWRRVQGPRGASRGPVERKASLSSRSRGTKLWSSCRALKASIRHSIKSLTCQFCLLHFFYLKKPSTTYSYGNDDVSKDADPAPMLLITPLDFHATLEDHLEEAVLNIRNPQKALV